MLCLLNITVTFGMPTAANRRPRRNEESGFRKQKKISQKYSQSPQILCCKSFSLDAWLVFESSSFCLNRLLHCLGSMQTTERCALEERGQLELCLTRVCCVAPFPSCHLSHFGKSYHLTVSQIFLTYKTGTLTSFRGAWGIN